MDLIFRPWEAHRRQCEFLLGPRGGSLVDPGIARDSLKIGQCRQRPARWVTSCAHAANKSAPRMSGWVPDLAGASRDCAARNWRCSPGLASTTTCDSSKAVTSTRPHRCSMRSPGRCDWMSKPQNICIGLAGLRAAHSPRPVAETAADGLDQLIDQISLPAIVTNRYQDVLAANAIARALSPRFAPGETSCGGGCWHRLLAISSSTGTRRPRSR
jgi:transcription regulator MmyB-like protein